MKGNMNLIPSRGLAIAAIWLALTVLSFAQSGGNLSITWSTIDGGGGTSTGGVYAVSGTIGQPDAGPALSGGPYAVNGGFWSIFSAVQTPGAPLLGIETLPTNGSVRLFWPAPATGFVLDQTSGLASPPAAITWTPVPLATYQTNVTHISIIVPPVGSRFYRLRHP